MAANPIVPNEPSITQRVENLRIRSPVQPVNDDGGRHGQQCGAGARQVLLAAADQPAPRAGTAGALGDWWIP